MDTPCNALHRIFAVLSRPHGFACDYNLPDLDDTDGRH